jgi:hypothetical protein
LEAKEHPLVGDSEPTAQVDSNPLNINLQCQAQVVMIAACLGSLDMVAGLAEAAITTIHQEPLDKIPMAVVVAHQGIQTVVKEMAELVTIQVVAAEANIIQAAVVEPELPEPHPPCNLQVDLVFGLTY